MAIKKNLSGSRISLGHSTVLLLTFVAAAVLVLRSTKRPVWLVGSPNLRRQDYSSCDLFSGRWVYDDSTHPLYRGPQCSFMNDEIACDKYGRNDTRYQSWRWQPHGCDLLMFEARELLERLRGKRMVYVGDSLNRNQWSSMVCLLESSIDTQHKSLKTNGSLISFRAEEFDISIDFYWAPLLVESNCDDPVNHRVSSRVMRAGSIEKHARHWATADVLVFNSYLWWEKPRMKMKVLYGPFEEDRDEDYKEVEMIEGFELALKAWSDWLEMHVNTHKIQVFFVSPSPTHARGEEWGMEGNRNCYNETEPVAQQGYRGGSDYRMLWLVEAAVERLGRRGVSVRMLNVTQLSEYRKDGHPSVYRKQWDTLSEDQLANPSSYADCNHWCLPGVPDVWNEFLYTYIISDNRH